MSQSLKESEKKKEERDIREWLKDIEARVIQLEHKARSWFQ